MKQKRLLKIFQEKVSHKNRVKQYAIKWIWTTHVDPGPFILVGISVKKSFLGGWVFPFATLG